MKLPNSYGSVIKLGGKRRKPYAVRISKLVEDDTGKVKRKYTYLAYTYGTYMNGNFNTCMGKLKMKHLPHDGRHTFASLMDSAGAQVPEHPKLKLLSTSGKLKFQTTSSQ